MILFVLSRALNIFDLRGSIAAFIVGFFVAVLGSLQWLILMIVFAAVSHVATISFMKQKKKISMQEGKEGERKTSNVVYAALIGLGIAIIHFIHPVQVPYFTLFAVSFAVIASDTFASEIGILDKKVFMITTFRRTTRGINGGISLVGQLAALLGSFIISITYSLLRHGNLDLLPIFAIGIMGFIGCQIDSVLGAAFENRGKLTKGEVNLLASLIAVIATGLIIIFYPGV
ncbi:hypothetical protein Thermo_00381 [Thermoplasmatales archaeon]|nr:hypothetical protein Thermo_00381 [Thermoplasmatales archaeon]